MIRIVFLGAGYASIPGGVAVKRALPDASVTLVNRSAYHTHPHHVPTVLAGRERLEDVRVDLVRYCRDHHLTFIQANAERIDRDERIIHTDKHRIPYDILILELPAEPAITIGGAAHALRVSGGESAIAIRTHLVQELKHARNTNRPRHRSVAVVGLGATGVEVITSVHELLDTLSREHCIFPQELDHIIIGAQHVDDPIPARPRARVARILDRRGIEWYDEQAKAFSADGVELADRTIETATVIWTADKRGHPLLESSGVNVDGHGRALVDRQLRTSDNRVFAVGPSAASREHDFPRTVWTAAQERDALVHNVLALAKRHPLKAFTPRRMKPILWLAEKRCILVRPNTSWYGRFPAWLRARRLKGYA